MTPNHHALAEQFVLLDNFYCNGVLSADGHQWTDEGYVTDYLEKSFGGWPRSYPYEGDDALAFASSGFIWDHVLRKGLTFRNYGEFVSAKITPPRAYVGRHLPRLPHRRAQRQDRGRRRRCTRSEPYLCPDLHRLSRHRAGRLPRAASSSRSSASSRRTANCPTS